MGRIRDFLTTLREMPWSAAVLAGLLAIAAIASTKLESFDDFEIESQLDGTRETLKICQTELDQTNKSLAETTLWMREYRAQWMETRAAIVALQAQNDELHEKRQEALEGLSAAAPVSRPIAASKPKKAVQRERRGRRTPSKDWWTELMKVMS